MTDRIDQEGRAAFVQTLPRKVTELRATLGTLVADPKSQRMRDELRRRLHALYTLTRSYQLPALSDGLREGIAHLDAVRGATLLTNRDLETLADLIATLASLAQRDLPDRPELFRRPRDRGPGSRSTVPGALASSGIALVPPGPPPRTTLPSLAPPVAPRPTPAGIDLPVPPEGAPEAPPLGVLVVASAGTVEEVKRALPAEVDLTAVHTLAEAVSAARDMAPDVILAESAPPADGLGLLAALRGDPLTDFLPVVLLSAPAEGLDAEAARAQGAAEVQPLPIDADRLRPALERAAQGMVQPAMPPPSFGEVTLEELTHTLQEEIRRGILGAAGPRLGSTRVSLGQGSEVLAATWEAIARVRDVVEKKTRGRVRFEMPAAPLGLGGAHVLAIGDEEETPADEAGAGDDPLPGRRALVVDDDPGVVWFFAGLLREAGMEVTECTEGAQALKDARRVRPDVVISDILMPGLDGFALCRAIRRDVSLRNTPVILLSWKEDLIVRMREQGAQAQGFLRKESRGDAILARVRAVLRPRVRLLRRLETLAEGAELRGRVERIGVFALLEEAARALGDATLMVTDSFSVTELELRESRLVAVVRTAQDGSFARGEGALLQVLGCSSARFALKRAQHSVRANMQGDLATLLAGGAALIAALEDSLSGAALLEVASIDLDGESAVTYARSLPESLRALVERVVRGDSPRDLVLRDGVAPQELEPILVELARRGAIRGVRGPSGEDLVAPRYAAALAGDEVAVPPAVHVSGTMPAVLRVPESSPPPAGEPAPSVRAEEPETAAWLPPSTIDEAAKPGFGLEGERDSLAAAVLRELSTPAGPSLEIAEEESEEPEFEEAIEEATLSAEELEKAARSTGLPLEGVELDARGLPRRRVSVPDLPAIEGEPFAPNERAPKVTTSSESIIVDESAIGAPVEVRENAVPTLPPRPQSPAPRRSIHRAPERTAPAGLIIAVLVAGLASFFGVRWILNATEPPPRLAPAAENHEPLIPVLPPTRPPEPTPPAPSEDPIEAAPSAPSEPETAPAAAEPSPPRAEEPAVSLVYEEPGAYLDGGTLPPGTGLLVIDTSDEITVNRRALGRGPTRQPLPAGTHTVTYRRGQVLGFRVVSIEAGRAARVVLPPVP